jgi:pimeloyl-ACP methyl ester carboxylesterase
MFREERFPCGSFALNGAVGPASGAPLVFFHGVSRCWQDFLTLMPAAALRWQTCAVDFRGHGKSDRSNRYLLVNHVADALAFLSQHIKEPAVLYGHSLGALVAAGVAALAPERVRGIVLEDPPAESILKNIRASVFHTLFVLLRSFAGQERSVADMARDLSGYLMPLPGAPGSAAQGRDAVSIRFMAKSLKSCDPEVLSPIIESRWLDGYEMEGTFKKVQCPALLLRGDEASGGMLPRPAGEELMRWLPDGTLIEWPGTGHLIHWFQSDKTAKFLTGFLEAL